MFEGIDLSQLTTAQVLVVTLAGGGLVAIINALINAYKQYTDANINTNSSNIKSCLELVDELKINISRLEERIKHLESDNAELYEKLLNILSKRREEDKELINKNSQLSAKVTLLEQLLHDERKERLLDRRMYQDKIKDFDKKIKGYEQQILSLKTAIKKNTARGSKDE